MKRPGARLRLRVLSAVWLTLFSPAILYAAMSTATVQVSVAIQPWLKFSVEQRLSSYTITPADVRQGYVDLKGAAAVNIRTNEKREIMLHVDSPDGGALLIKDGAAADFVGMGVPINLGRQAPGVPATRQIDCRVLLPAGARVGTYPLSLAVSLQAE
jgi:hypothetical protein